MGGTDTQKLTRETETLSPHFTEEHGMISSRFFEMPSAIRAPEKASIISHNCLDAMMKEESIKRGADRHSHFKSQANVHETSQDIGIVIET